MTFEEWLSRCGYRPVEVIKSSYRMSGSSEDEIENRIEELKKEYQEDIEKV